MKLALDYYKKDFDTVENIDNDNYVRLIMDATGAISNELNVDDKPVIEEWLIDDEFVNKDLKITEESKAFIRDLIKRNKFCP